MLRPLREENGVLVFRLQVRRAPAKGTTEPNYLRQLIIRMYIYMDYPICLVMIIISLRAPMKMNVQWFWIGTENKKDGVRAPAKGVYD